MSPELAGHRPRATWILGRVEVYPETRKPSAGCRARPNVRNQVLIAAVLAFVFLATGYRGGGTQLRPWMPSSTATRAPTAHGRIGGPDSTGTCVTRRTLRDDVLRSQRGQLFVAEPEDLGQDLIGVLTQ